MFEPRILSAVKKLIGEEIVYFGESNTQSGPTLGGFHKDNRVCDRENEAGLDFVGDYPLVRVGIYLQDSDIYSGGLKIVPGSHKIPTSKFRIGGNNIAAKAGDIVVWKLTTTHSGHAKRLKILNNISLHPRIESYIPSLLENINPIETICVYDSFCNWPPTNLPISTPSHAKPTIANKNNNAWLKCFTKYLNI